MNPQYSPESPESGQEPGSRGGATENAATLTETKLARTAREAASKVKQAAGSAAGHVRDEARRVVIERKDTAAKRVGAYSSALHDSADRIGEKDPNIAWFTHRAADRLQGVADYLRERDYAGLRGDCEDLARRHPAAFFGGMFVAGLLIGNFAKATARGVRRSRQDGFDGESTDEESPGLDAGRDPHAPGQEPTGL